LQKEDIRKAEPGGGVGEQGEEAHIQPNQGNLGLRFLVIETGSQEWEELHFSE